ncbi:murein DD-endopeptidase MepM/ murein hydrolase activator NlpD [Nocardioides daedukensis]|uniref:Murein DD-endopeptidase MepM/ murein hydrolase activator NlpD n=1 Tax=Nocardioides daedukensis TaxID=634462 RepID=A0A7Y9S1R3_9ACTN|nr:M23 family metallopeptidase [Nocardioides daedukensis]NYG58134.1 murein DD-endopeptidase MepM/ murein hydrolase activator NlpD [Nocardioides daedukensis]
MRIVALLGLLVGMLLTCAVGGGSGAFADPGGEQPTRGVWPLDPRPAVVGGFAPPTEKWGAGHRGVDLNGSAGQPVRASLPGTISFAGSIAGRGVVSVEHGDTRTTYEPVVASVDVGDPVSAGEVIGRLELRGSHCLPAACLHWGWLRGSAYLDPLDLVGAARVRLLPPGGLPAPTLPSEMNGESPGGAASVVPGLGTLLWPSKAGQ